mmetsp:Transcript_54339/g.172587  ORF Transcript_54339/g.172587 Transcript_54339/m.172587 type:complete len:463 (+) Transcript_54339:344-1732(+)
MEPRHGHHHKHATPHKADNDVGYDVVEMSADVIEEEEVGAGEDGGGGTQYYGKSLPHPPAIAQPEWAYGGTWARKKNDARRGGQAPTPQCHATTLLNLPGGKVMMGWFGGTFESAEDVKIFTAVRSSDGSWGKPVMSAKVHRNVPYNGKKLPGEPARKGGEPHWNPVLHCADTSGEFLRTAVCPGKVLLYFKVGWKIPEWETFVTASEDGGATWEKPRELVPGDHGGRGPVKNKVLVLSSGTWVAPASLENGLGNLKKAWRGFVDISEDGGVTWVKSSEVQPPHPEKWGAIQPTLWESRPGHVHMLMRSSKGHRARVWRADSEDGGRTWGAAYQTELPNNNSGLDVVRLPKSGTLVLAYNPSEGDRYPMRLAFSEDNGKTWPEGHDVEVERGHVKDHHEFSYPAIVSWPAGDEEGFSLSYTWHRMRPAYLSMSLKTLQDLATRINPANQMLANNKVRAVHAL